ETQRLYQLAVKHSWQVAESVNWQAKVCFSRSPLAPELLVWIGFPAFEKLPAPERNLLAWKLFIFLLSDIYHGELAALTLAAQLAATAEKSAEKLSLGAQVFEEARHVEFFQLLFGKLDAQIQPASPALQHLIDEAVASESRMEKLLVCQLIIENLALVRFQQLLAHSRLELLQQGLRRILQDEARHVSLGPLLIKQQLLREPDSPRQDYPRFVFDAVYSLRNDFSVCLQIARQHDWEIVAFRRHLRLHLLQQKNMASQLQKRLQRALTAAGLKPGSTGLHHCIEPVN
ncbi:MAG: ferritin-like domain-containing protein, partial [Pseudomonadales bacterium]|nr:ferritin-like domain-containing protein [Pseudomonadales bacterium]